MAIKVPLSGIMAPGHSARVREGMGESSDWRGVVVTLGPPEPPTPHYICDTDVIWPILDEKVVSHSGVVRDCTEYKNTLCRHQIIAGD